MSATDTAPTYPPVRSKWQRIAANLVGAFHIYGGWLASISWKRFAVLSVLLVITTLILEEIPPFSWTFTETIQEARGLPEVSVPPLPVPPLPATDPEVPASAVEPEVRVERLPSGGTPRGSTARDPDGVDISIDERGIRITPRASPKSGSAGSAGSAAASAAESAAAAASGALKTAQAAADEAASAAQAAAAAADAVQVTVGVPGEPAGPQISIRLPAGATKAQIDEAISGARDALREAMREARSAAEFARETAEQAAQAAREAAEEAAQAAREATEEAAADLEPTHRIRTVHMGDVLSDLAMLWVFASAILKFTYKGRVQAEVKAAAAMQTASVAVQTAESEQLRRQVVEARMAAMQAQVEPHFLFNTLASIDHLIETDPSRASTMQKNLIALLRASMPTMREASDGGVRPLGRELAVIRPYLEILKVRMEERLDIEVRVPDGLLSAEFPPMMVQTLVENAIKHGLEPKPEGGRLLVTAEVVHGRLAVTVADTGVGFGRAPTAGTGVGLANIRERLDLVYGSRATLAVTENTPQGTVVTITVPYKSIEGART